MSDLPLIAPLEALHAAARLGGRRARIDAGGVARSPAMAGFVLMAKDGGFMFVTGPDMVKTVTREPVSQEELGDAVAHTTKSGVADDAFDGDIEALLAARGFVDLLPATGLPTPRGKRPRKPWKKRDEISYEPAIT